jgi:hypothetical protein
MSQEAKLHELEELRAKVKQLEAEVGSAGPVEQPEWPPREFYTVYFVLAGFVLGAIGAMASLLFNIVGSLLVGQAPLRLIQVYLTFPLGEPALSVDNGLTLAIGCCLYLLTGMVLGIPFHLTLSRCCEGSAFATKFIVVTVLALILWIVNFYGLIAWLQPALIGGNWIVQEIPWWVAASTHLVFGWTMLAVQPLGKFVAR